MSEAEVRSNTPTSISMLAGKREVAVKSAINGKPINRSFAFDQVYASNTTNQEVYEQTVLPMIDEVLQGFNCTVFAYGACSGRVCEHSY